MKKWLCNIRIFITTSLAFWCCADVSALPCDDLNCKITQIIINTDTLIEYNLTSLSNNPVIKMPYDHNSIKFVFLGETADINCQGQIEYCTFLENYNETWTPWSNLREADFVNLRDGNYVFKVRAKFSDEVISNIAEYKFTIKPPFFRSKWAYILYILIIAATAATIVSVYKRSFNKERKTLLNALNERTRGLEDTNQELKRQKDSLDKTIKDLSMLSSAGQNIIKNLSIKEISLACYKELNNFFHTDDSAHFLSKYNVYHLNSLTKCVVSIVMLTLYFLIQQRADISASALCLRFV